MFSPVSPSKSTPDDSSFGESLACLPCHVSAQQQVDETFQKLQEELVACKLREAESSLGFKELQQKVNQLGRQWQVQLCGLMNELINYDNDVTMMAFHRPESWIKLLCHIKNKSN